jgi:hypothetical protein
VSARPTWSWEEQVEAGEPPPGTAINYGDEGEAVVHVPARPEGETAEESRTQPSLPVRTRNSRAGWSRKRVRRTRFLLLGCLVAGSLAASGKAAGASAEQQLVERYAPIQKLKVNDDLPCGSVGEQYALTSVETTLGNPEVKLELVMKGTPRQLIKRGATAKDISGLSEEYYLNQPGVPNRPAAGTPATRSG